MSYDHLLVYPERGKNRHAITFNQVFKSNLSIQNLAVVAWFVEQALPIQWNPAFCERQIKSDMW